jgi:hypothetical protein
MNSNFNTSTIDSNLKRMKEWYGARRISMDRCMTLILTRTNNRYVSVQKGSGCLARALDPNNRPILLHTSGHAAPLYLL